MNPNQLREVSIDIDQFKSAYRSQPTAGRGARPLPYDFFGVLMKYEQIYDGQWIMPKRKYFYEQCCDCGLVHKVEFKVVKRKILFRAWRIKCKKKKATTLLK